MKKALFFSTLFVGLIFLSCGDDDGDTTKPLIEVTSPASGSEYLVGETITVTADLSDNEALGSCKVHIHYGEGHSHSNDLRAEISVEEEKEFVYQVVIDTISHKKEAKITANIIIPETIDGKPVKKGTYHLGVSCFDLVGNENHHYTDIIIAEE